MKQIEAKIIISDKIFVNEYDYTFGKKKNEKVDFTFVNIVTAKVITKHAIFTYRQALNLARERRNDGRYKNYEYVIG
jgi:hypothetical protein